MRLNTGIAVGIVLSLMTAQALAWEANNLGAAGGWDDINDGSPITAVLDVSDFTNDLPSGNVASALTSAFNTWDNVAQATTLSFQFKPDRGGNYDVFDGPNGTLDQSADFRYANVVIGGFLPQSYFGNPNILAVTWTGKLYGGAVGKPVWVAEIFFNDAWNWTDDGAAADADLANGLLGGLIDLETVALHELGHAIGLGHETDVPSVMATYYKGTQRDLLPDDIAGITALYSASAKGGGNDKGGGKGKGGGPNKLLPDLTDMYLTGVTYLDGAVPEPATMSLLALGALALLKRRK